MKALILIQDELVSKFPLGGEGHTEGMAGESNLGQSDSAFPHQQQRKPEDRMIVLCIAYHNIAVE